MTIYRFTYVWACALAVACALCGAAAARAQSAPLPPGTSTDEPQASQSRAASATESPLNAAESKLAQGDYAGAHALLAPYLSAHPDDARALFDSGYIEDAQGHADAAEPLFRKAIAADPKQFEAHLALGLLLARELKRDEAADELTEASKLTPNPPNPAAVAQADRALAHLLRTDDPEAARQALLAALKLSPETLDDTLLTGEIAEADGDDDTAEEAYRGVLAAAPNAGPERAQATAGLAHLLIVQKKYTDAELLLRKALAQSPQDVTLSTQLVSVLSAEKMPEDAQATLEAVYAAQPDNLPVARMLADLYTQNGVPAKADPLYIKLLSATPNDAELLASRGDNLVRQKRNLDAIAVLQQATKLDPKNGDAWSSLAFAASESQQPQLTIDALAMRSKVLPETPATYFLAATSWDTLHQTKRAVEMYKQFLAVAGSNFPDQEWQAKHRLVALDR